MVTGGTPSMSLRSARPCQWSEVGSGRWLLSVATRVSPAVVRTGVPGREPKVQVRAVVPPPRSTVSAVAVTVTGRSRPVPPRAASARATGLPEGSTSGGGAGLSEQAASRPAPAAPRPASRRERRLTVNSGIEVSRVCARGGTVVARAGGRVRPAARGRSSGTRPPRGAYLRATERTSRSGGGAPGQGRPGWASAGRGAGSG